MGLSWPGKGYFYKTEEKIKGYYFEGDIISVNKGKLTTNIAYNLAYQILVLIIPIITAPYISRALDVDGVGIFSYVSSVAYYFFIAITLGLNNYGNRAIAKCGDNRELRDKTFWSIYFMQLSIGFIVLLLYIIYAFTLSDPRYRQYFLIYTIYVFSASIDINWFFFGMQQFKLTTTRSAVIRLLALLSIFLFVKGQNALIYYLIIVAGSSLCGNIVLWVQIRKFTNFYKPVFREVIVHCKPNLILFISILAISIYRVMDKIMIKELSSVIQNGYYENADRIITISLSAFSAVSTVMMPAISTMVSQGKTYEVRRYLRDVMQITTCLSVAMSIGLAVISKRFAPLFFGKQYGETGILLMGLSSTLFLSGWKNVLRSQFLIPYEKDRAYVISLVSGAAVNVIINYFLIPLYGARGAVIGTLCAELTGFIIQTYVVGKTISIIELFKDALIFVPAGLIMGLVVYFVLMKLPDHILSIILSMIIGAVIYIAFAAFSLWIIDKSRFKYFKDVLFIKK